MNKSVAKVFNKRQHQLPSPCKELVLPMAKVGIEVEVENYAAGLDNTPQLWEVKADHSLRNNGAEFVTRGGLVGSELVEAIHSLMHHCKKYNYDEGLPRAGIHIHLDVTDMNAANSRELLHFVGTYMLTEHIFFQFAGDWRSDTGYCDPLNFSKGDYKAIGTILRDWDTLGESELRQFWAGAPQNGVHLSKYQAINLLPMHTFGTVEFRHLPTTFDADRLITWINMILCVKAFAQNGPTEVPLEVLVSRLTPLGFYQRVFGSLFDKLAYQFDYTAAWKAIDNYQALITPVKPEYFYDGNVNELIAAKIKLRKPSKPKAKPQEAELAAPLQPNVIRWNPEREHDVWLRAANELAANDSPADDQAIVNSWNPGMPIPQGFEQVRIIRGDGTLPVISIRRQAR